jgi:glycosyltransferase involved in cell wall biosynthesis
MSDHSLARLGENGRELAERKFAWKTIANRMIAIYAWLLGQGDCPADVRLK